MKKSLIQLILFCIIAVTVFYSCSFSPPQKYQNFILDLDLITRFEVCIFEVEHQQASIYTVDELKTLKHDIANWPGNYATESNENLTECADLLLQSIAYSESDQTTLAAETLQDAKDRYAKAKAFIRRNNKDADE